MLFDPDDAVLGEIVGLGRDGGRFKDERDLDLDRLLNSSPPMAAEHSGIFEMAMSSQRTEVIEVSSLPNEPTIEATATNKTNPLKKGRSTVFRLEAGEKISFKPVPVPPPLRDNNKNLTGTPSPMAPPPTSSLSKLLNNSSGGGGNYSGNSKGGKIPLTIYLPDYSSMTVLVHESNNFDQVIVNILKAHKDLGQEPPLHYNAPRFYELRMHEGDGEPDKDFPPLDRSKTLKQFYERCMENELCLCEVDEDAPRSSTLSFARESSIISPKTMSTDSNFVKITLPHVGYMKIGFDDSMTLRDLLPHICRKHRLRLFTDEYSFIITPEEQSRLKLMSPIVDSNTLIKNIDLREFELQKRVYADAAKVVRPTGKNTSSGPGGNATDGIIYTEATASVYQEWNIVKKNKYGRKQERIIGIDGKKVYNSKRDKYSRNPTGVQRAQRDISSIRKIEKVPGDSKTFRILWEQGREIVDIEYTCETPQACGEIVAKISFLLDRVYTGNNFRRL